MLCNLRLASEPGTAFEGQDMHCGHTGPTASAWASSEVRYVAQAPLQPSSVQTVRAANPTAQRLKGLQVRMTQAEAASLIGCHEADSGWNRISKWCTC